MSSNDQYWDEAKTGESVGLFDLEDVIIEPARGILLRLVGRIAVRRQRDPRQLQILGSDGRVMTEHR